MIGKMLIHGILAAILIAGAAAVYAQAVEGDHPPASPAARMADEPSAAAGNGYLSLPPNRAFRDKSGREQAQSPERGRDGHAGDERRRRHRDRHND